MKLIKTIKMCLKCRLLFIILCFREFDEKKNEVEDERGIKRRKEESGVFILSQSTKSRVFDLIRKQGKQHIICFRLILVIKRVSLVFEKFEYRK